MQGKDFAIWLFAALMVLSPMTLAATTRTYHGEQPVAAAQAPVTAPASAPTSTAPKTP